MTAAALSVVGAGLLRGLLVTGLLAALALIGYGVLDHASRLGGPSWRPRRADLALPLALSLGALVAGWLSFTAALASTWLVGPAWAALLLASLGARRQLGGDAARVFRRLRALAAAAPVASAALGLALAALLPPLFLPLWDSDGIRYQVALPKLFLLAGRVVPYPWDVHAALPQLFGGLLLAALPPGGGEVAKLLHAGFFVAALATLALLLHRERRSRRAAVYGPLLLAIAPVAAVPATSAFVDHAALFHLVVAALLVSRARGAASLLPIGASVATKTTAGPGAAVLLVLAAAAEPRGRRLRLAALGVAALLLSFAPFGLRNLAATGDPVFPVGHVLLGRAVPGTDPQLVRKVLQYRPDATAPLGIGWFPGEPGLAADDLAGPALLLGLLALPVALRGRRGHVLLALATAYLLVGAVSRPLPRLLMPLFLALAGAAALGADRWLRRAATPVVVALSAGTFALATAPALGLGPAVEHLAGRLGRDAFLSRAIPGYRAALFVNGQPGGRVMALDFPGPYYLARPWIAEGVVNEPPLRLWLAAGADGAGLLARCRELGVTHLLVTPGWGGGTPASLFPLARNRREAEAVAAFRSRLRRVATVEGVDVFELPR
ncbi:MAG: hypothetical protein U0529_21385 [Thermoanaerobaculia bacterium]